MPFNLILLPLLGGFWFIVIYYRTRFQAVQASRERLILYAATAGLVLAIVARVIAVLMNMSFPDTVAAAKALMLPWDYSGTAMLAALLGPAAAGALNMFTDKERANRDAIKRFGGRIGTQAGEIR